MPLALKLWDLLWKDGYKIRGIGGSDSHMLPSETYAESDKPSVIGDPCTYVLAQGLPAAETLEGVSKGHVYVSREVELDIRILCNGQTYIIYKSNFKGSKDYKIMAWGQLVELAGGHQKICGYY